MDKHVCKATFKWLNDKAHTFWSNPFVNYNNKLKTIKFKT